MKVLFVTILISLILGCTKNAPLPNPENSADSSASPIQYINTVTIQQEQEASNEALARKLVSSLGTSSYDAVAAEILAPGNRVIRSEFEHLLYNATDSKIKSKMQPMPLAIPDRNNEIDVLVAEGELVMMRYRITGTHQGNFYGIKATNNSFKIPSVALLRFRDGKVISTWYMADEVGLLRQIGQQMPKREDGRWILPPVKGGKAKPANELIKNLIANPDDTQEYRNKWQVVQRRTSPRPPGRPFRENYRGGHFHIIDAGKRYGDPAHEFGGAFSDRSDLIEYVISNENVVAVKFRLTAVNTGSMFGLPPTNNTMDNWEIAFAWFEGDEWTYSWFFGDDMGMLHQLGGKQEYFVPEPGVIQPSAVTP